MRKALILALITLLLCSSIIVEAKRLRQKTLKKSLPYSQVLQRAKDLMGSDNQSKIDEKLKSLKNSSQDEVVNFFANHKYTNVQDYWLQYYLLAETLLFNDKQWQRPTMDKIEDSLYDEIVAQEEEYNEAIATCKAQSNFYLSNSSEDALVLGDEGTLYDLEYNYDTLELIQDDKFFNLLSKSLPKGIIHHIHWSAGTDYIGFYNSIQSALGNQAEGDEKIVVVSAQVHLEDVTVGKKMTEKFFTKYFLTKQKYVDPSKLQSVINDNKSSLDGFSQNIMQKGRCLNYQIDNNQFNPANVDMYLRGFLYWNSCKGTLYDDVMSQNGQARPMSELKDTLKETVAVFMTDEAAIKKLPKAYLKDNKSETKETQEILGVWFFFEQIFQSLSEFTDNKDIFNALTTNMFQVLQDQNTYGIEFRNKNDDFQIGSFQASSDQFQIPYSYITPGRKVAGKGSKGSSIVQGAKKITNPHFAGIDFFAFEDDPYNGARNFFPSAFTDVQQGDTQSYFDQMFDYLNNGNGQLYLHAGETQFFPQGNVAQDFIKKNYINDNLLHAVLLPGVERIGHGFEAYKNNLLLSIIKQRNISFESCPISNQVLNFNEVYTNPFLEILRSGLHVAISPDDPGLFGYIGVAMDWYYVIMSTDIKASEIYLLLKNSIIHSSIKEVKENQQEYLELLKEDLISFFAEMKNECSLPTEN